MRLYSEFVVGRKLCALEIRCDVLEVLEHLQDHGHVGGVSARFILYGYACFGGHIRDLPLGHLVDSSGVAFGRCDVLHIRSGSVGCVLGCYGPLSGYDIRDDQLLGLIGHIGQCLVYGPHLLRNV